MKDEILEERKKTFKETSIDSVREIEEYASKLRKQKKEVQLQTKRNKGISEEELPDNKLTIEKLNKKLAEINPSLGNLQAPLEERMKYALEELNTMDMDRLQIILLFVRKVLAQVYNTPIEFAVKLGFTSKLSELLNNENEQICLNAAWALTNLAAGSSEAVKEMRALGTQYKLVTLLATGSPAIKEQSLWVLGNITGDSIEARDELLKTFLVEKLVELISSKVVVVNLLKVACWTISNLCKGKPSPPLERIKVFPEYLGNILFVDDEEIVSDTLWALSYITDGEKAAIKLVEKFVKLERVSFLLQHSNPLIKKPALRVLGNICIGDTEDVGEVLKSGCLPQLIHILNVYDQPEFLRETCWVLSNIAVDSKEHIDKLINSQAVKALVSLTKRKQDLFIRREALWALTNAINSGTSEQIFKMVDEGVLDVLADSLEIQDPQLVYVILGSIDKALSTGSQVGVVNVFAMRFDSIGGRRKLETLQHHGNKEIYKKTVEILVKYYDVEEVAPEENAYEMEIDEDNAVGNTDYMPE